MNKRYVLILLAVLLVLTIAGVTIAISGSFDTAERQIKLAYKLLDEGKYEEAILAFEKVVQIEPRGTRAYAGLGVAHAHTGNYDKAFATVENALAMDLDKQELLHETYVSIFLIKGDTSGAEAYINTITEQRILDYLKKKFPVLFKEISQRVVEFEDKEFEKMVRKIIHKEEGEIYNTDLLYIEEIIITGMHVGITPSRYYSEGEVGQITSYLVGDRSSGETYTERGQISTLKDIQYFPNLKTLKINFQTISDIHPLSAMTNLTTLHLFANQINDISALSGLTNLTSLGLGGNKASDISPLKALTNLTYLGIGGNQIDDINILSRLANLTFLDISRNQISDIKPLSELTNLTILHLNNNKINDIRPLSGLTNLTFLNLHENQINNISTLSVLTNLTSLFLLGNPINDYSPALNLPNLDQSSREWLGRETQ